MKEVLLLGDSIRMFYQKRVEELLGEKYHVSAPEENGRFAAYTFNSLRMWLPEFPKPDIIHWNNGLWDTAILYAEDGCFTPVDEYIRWLERTLRKLRTTGAQIIFATTTPILDAGSAEDNTGTGAGITYNDAWVRAYNEAAGKVMAEEGVPVNDLYALCKEDKNYYKCADMLHLTEEGYRRCAEQAAAMILKELGE